MDPLHSSDQLVANTRLPKGELRELASGIDALYLSGRAELPKRLLGSVVKVVILIALERLVGHFDGGTGVIATKEAGGANGMAS